MIDKLPFYLPLVFILTTLLTLVLFYRASGFSKPTLLFILALMLVQGLLGYQGFYTVTDTMPPRFPLLVAPAMLCIILLFVLRKGRQYIDRFDQRTLTWLHIIRVPVEMVLLGLYVHQQIPELMTFEGRNFDIVSGITAPMVAFFMYRKPNLNKTVLLLWNFVCLGLLINVVTHAVLAAPSPFQQLAFDQPNVGVLYFPFVWLPAIVVPLVLFSHLICIRQIIRYKNS